MKKITVLLAIAVLTSLGASAQPYKSFFPDSLPSQVGSYFYPEHWPESQWDGAFKLMSQSGFTFTHFAEFAWDKFEPSEGVYKFDWLDRAINLAQKHGLKVVLCTPTATPPSWLTQKYPEVLMHDGKLTMQHGTRQHGSWSSKVYREKVSAIVTAMAKHYALNTNVWGWQIDNEPSHYGKYDYSKVAQTHFRQWLKKRYNNNIAELNNAWGTAFWSIVYQSFEQIDIPQGKVENPHPLLDYKRFYAESCAEFVCMQAQILKQYTKNQFVTTNYMGFHTPINNLASAHCLDFTSYTAYPASNYASGKNEIEMRSGRPAYLVWSQKLNRAANGITGCMEMQPGQVNWGNYMAQPLPNTITNYLYHAFALGDRFACNYRFDKPTFGSELYFQSILDPNQKTITQPGAIEFVQFAKHIKQLKGNSQVSPLPADWAKRKTAVLFDFNSIWDIENHPQNKAWRNDEVIFNYVDALSRNGATFDVVNANADFSQYPYLVVLINQLYSDKLVEKLLTYAQNGGHIYITPRSLTKDTNGIFPQKPYADAACKLLDIDKLEYDNLPDGLNGEINFEGKKLYFNKWAEILTPKPNNDGKIWATHQSFFYTGKAAVYHRSIGKGSVTYNGVLSIDGEAEFSTLNKLYAQTGANPLSLPKNVFIHYRDGKFFAFNYSGNTFQLPTSKSVQFEVGSQLVKPMDFAVYKF